MNVRFASHHFHPIFHHQSITYLELLDDSVAEGIKNSLIDTFLIIPRARPSSLVFAGPCRGIETFYLRVAEAE